MTSSETKAIRCNLSRDKGRVLALMQFTRCANDELEGQDSLPRRAPLALLDERGQRGRKGVRTDALSSTGLSTASNQVRFHGTAISSSVKAQSPLWGRPLWADSGPKRIASETAGIRTIAATAEYTSPSKRTTNRMIPVDPSCRLDLPHRRRAPVEKPRRVLPLHTSPRCVRPQNILARVFLVQCRHSVRIVDLAPVQVEHTHGEGAGRPVLSRIGPIALARSIYKHGWVSTTFQSCQRSCYARSLGRV